MQKLISPSILFSLRLRYPWDALNNNSQDNSEHFSGSGHTDWQTDRQASDSNRSGLQKDLWHYNEVLVVLVLRCAPCKCEAWGDCKEIQLARPLAAAVKLLRPMPRTACRHWWQVSKAWLLENYTENLCSSSFLIKWYHGLICQNSEPELLQTLLGTADRFLLQGIVSYFSHLYFLLASFVPSKLQNVKKEF